jgi:hypothetical protein
MPCPYLESRIISLTSSLRYKKLYVGVCHAGVAIEISIKGPCTIPGPSVELSHSLEGVHKWVCGK